MRGKKICNSLKKVRMDIAKANGIEYEVTECSHKGECAGTCPKCESEVRYLERELEKRRRSGFKVVLAGVSAGLVAINAAACAPIGTTMGDMQADSTDTTETAQSEGELATLMGEPVESEYVEVGEYPEETTEEPPIITAGIIPLESEDETEELWLDGDVAFIEPEEIALAGVMPAPEELEETETEPDNE